MTEEQRNAEKTYGFFFGADEVDTSPTNKSIHLSILLQLQR